MRTISIALLAAALLGTAASDADEVVPAKPKPAACFFVRDFQGWKAAHDAKSIYIRVDSRHFLRLELASSCPTLNWPDARLITTWHGTTSACDALDWDLKVSQGPPGNFAIPCIVKKVHEMSKEEVDALPKKERP